MSYLPGLFVIFLFAALSFFSLRQIFRKRYGSALLLILGLATVLRVFMAGDLFLHDWDERFHANIAKQIFDNPFSPTLYADSVLEYDFARWSESKLFLSKPLLPFWILGSSISLFGANEFGLRLPSLLLGLCAVWLTYRIGRLLFDDQVGLLGAFLHAIQGLILELNGGLLSSDHVDVLFTLLFQASLYAYLLFCARRQTRQLLLTGLLIGLAFLTKWIMACFIPAIITIVHLWQVKRPEDYFKHLSVLTLAAIGTCLPWLTYLWQHHQQEIQFTFQQFFARVDTGFEGHSGGAFAYLQKVITLFGAAVYLPLGWILYEAGRKRSLRTIFLAAWVWAPLLLLSFLATKRATYLIMCAPAYFLVTGAFISSLLASEINWLPRKKWIRTGLASLLLGLPVAYSLERIAPFRPRFVTPEWKTELARLANEHAADKIVLSGEAHAMDAMFYYDLLAYQRKLREDEIEKFIAAGYSVISREKE